MRRRSPRKIQEEDAPLPDVPEGNEEEPLSEYDSSDYEESLDSEPEVTLNVLERQPRVTAGTIHRCMVSFTFFSRPAVETDCG